MIITSIRHLIKNIKNYTELVKNGEIIVAEDEEAKIILVKKDKINGLK